ncbi:hypothetical protein E2I00_000812 [Balaenoptera physalus]|uniref:C2H2-type domain-containing protein n=1 Tax=Balaenoptera physalus TaxID=9770 RepID=A0A643BP21_BALPH|nr:hypothetical protein E2I00_000812 [Balaenoptera physalus]
MAEIDPQSLVGLLSEAAAEVKCTLVQSRARAGLGSHRDAAGHCQVGRDGKEEEDSSLSDIYGSPFERSEDGSMPQSDSRSDALLRQRRRAGQDEVLAALCHALQDLEQHVHQAHKPFKCRLCSYVTLREESLLSHIEKDHITAQGPRGGDAFAENGKPELPPGEFPCEVCGQAFSQTWFLKAHMKKHRGSFDHGCHICGRRFKEPLVGHCGSALAVVMLVQVPGHRAWDALCHVTASGRSTAPGWGPVTRRIRTAEMEIEEELVDSRLQKRDRKMQTDAFQPDVRVTPPFVFSAVLNIESFPLSLKVWCMGGVVEVRRSCRSSATSGSLPEQVHRAGSQLCVIGDLLGAAIRFGQQCVVRDARPDDDSKVIVTRDPKRSVFSPPTSFVPQDPDRSSPPGT